MSVTAAYQRQINDSGPGLEGMRKRALGQDRAGSRYCSLWDKGESRGAQGS